MKTVFVLLAIAVTYTCGAPVKQLKELKEQVDPLLKKLPKEQQESIFVMEIEKNVFNDCKPEFFCQVERVLSGNKKLSELSEFQKQQGLLRHLSAYNQNHVPDFFCQVELALSENKQLYQQLYQGLQRHLSAYNQNQLKNCTVQSTGDEITLHLFLQRLNKCIQKKTSQAK